MIRAFILSLMVGTSAYASVCSTDVTSYAMTWDDVYNRFDVTAVIDVNIDLSDQANTFKVWERYTVNTGVSSDCRANCTKTVVGWVYYPNPYRVNIAFEGNITSGHFYDVDNVGSVTSLTGTVNGSSIHNTTGATAAFDYSISAWGGTHSGNTYYTSSAVGDVQLKQPSTEYSLTWTVTPNGAFDYNPSKTYYSALHFSCDVAYDFNNNIMSGW